MSVHKFGNYLTSEPLCNAFYSLGLNTFVTKSLTPSPKAVTSHVQTLVTTIKKHIYGCYYIFDHNVLCLMNNLPTSAYMLRLNR